MIQFSIKPKAFKKPVMSLAIYALVFLLMNFSVGYLCYSYYGFQQPIDWVLAGLYLSLSVISYYVFVVNDTHATSFKGRTTALGFLAVHLALSVLVTAFIFNTPIKLVWYLAGLLLSLSYLLGFYGITLWSKNQRAARQQLQHELLTDELTQLYNRRALAQHAKHEEQFAVDSNTHISVLIIDIDDFKPVNDQYGHAVGDDLLRQISQLFKHRINKLGEVYRWGGEEFVAMLPVTGLFEANQLANKLINKVSAHTFNIKQLLELKVTVSVGVAQWLPEESICKETLERADMALYKAKAAGKNAVAVADFKDISQSGEAKLKDQPKGQAEDQTKLA